MRNPKRLIAMLAVMLSFINGQHTLAQSETPKLELGIHFATLRSGPFDTASPGVGSRVTYNFTDNLSFEGEVNYFHKDGYNETRRTQALFGLKPGVRFDKVGLFGKIRPGFIHASQIQVQNYPCSSFGGGVTGGDPLPHCFYAREGRSSFALDLGAVIEFYPSRKTAVRFDIGDTVIRNRSLLFGIGTIPSSGYTFTTHNLQINAGVGFRF
ncbi:MAG: porin family protein [Gammaproteobacteria bacterium]|nr:porin family protein [Gammaproteobacteria bacterium]